MLWRLADLVQTAERRRSFRAKAYRRAIWSLDSLPPDLDVDEEDLLATPGIGSGVAGLIAEYRSTGMLNQLIPLEEAYPAESARLRRLPRMTPTILRELHVALGVDDRADLLAAIDSSAIETIKGVGPTTVALWKRILDLPPSPEHVPAHQAWVEAETLRAHITKHLDCWVDLAGAVRRVEEWVDRIDLVAVSEQPEELETFLSTTAVLSRVESTEPGRTTGATHSGLAATVRHSPPEASGTSLLWATGPVAHAETITREPFATEHEAYRSVDLAPIPPPARGLPIDRAAGVVRVEDLRGDLHLHTDGSPDGRMSLETLLRTAVASNYEYVLITDHTLGLRFGGLGPADIEAQAAEIAALRPQFPEITIFQGAELNIGMDGSLDLDDQTLDLLDFAVAGVHSYFQMDGETQTKRVLAALEHPKVGILAHPFGRRIGIRPALGLDMERVIEGAVANRVALETNGHRDRLDLPADWVGRAADRGAIFAANSDAHRVEEMPNVANAVATLQRAGVGADRVLNTFAASEVTRWLVSGSRGGEGGI